MYVFENTLELISFYYAKILLLLTRDQIISWIYYFLGIAIGIGISELSAVSGNVKGSSLMDTIEASHQHHIIISILQGTISEMLTGSELIKF